MFALDYDGVIADTNTQKSEWILRHCGIHVPSYKCDRSSCVPLIGEDAYQEMGQEVYGEYLSLRARPVPGLKESLESLKGYGPLHIISARNGKQLQSAHLWLEQQSLRSYFEGIYVLGNINKVSRAVSLGCQILIDDDPRHLTVETEKKVIRILLKIGADDSPVASTEFLFCRSWKEAVRKAIEAVRR